MQSLLLQRRLCSLAGQTKKHLEELVGRHTAQRSTPCCLCLLHLLPLPEGHTARVSARVVDAAIGNGEGLTIGECTLEEKRPNDVQHRRAMHLQVPPSLVGIREESVLLVIGLVILKHFLLTSGKTKRHLIPRLGSLGAGVPYGQAELSHRCIMGARTILEQNAG